METTKQEKNQLTYILALAISLILNPINMILLILIGISISFKIPYLTIFAVMFPFILTTSLFIIYKVIVKKDSDWDFTKLEMRKNLGITSALGYVVTIILAYIFVPDLTFLFLKAGIVIIIAGLITLKWKISFHAIGYTCFCLTYIELFGPIWLLTFLLMPIMYWARLKLLRHTLPQLLAGSLLSLIIML